MDDYSLERLKERLNAQDKAAFQRYTRKLFPPNKGPKGTRTSWNIRGAQVTCSERPSRGDPFREFLAAVLRAVRKNKDPYPGTWRYQVLRLVMDPWIYELRIRCSGGVEKDTCYDLTFSGGALASSRESAYRWLVTRLKEAREGIHTYQQKGIHVPEG